MKTTIRRMRSYAVDGDTALTLTLTYADGSTQTLTRRITVG